VVMGHLMLCPELSADVSGVAHFHCLWVEDVDLDEGAEYQLLKSGSVPSLLYFTRLHQIPCFISLGDSDCNILYYSHITAIVVITGCDTVI